MNIKELYEQKSLVATNLKDCIRDRGYTKISFANKLGMDKSELENILAGVIEHDEIVSDVSCRSASACIATMCNRELR